MPPSEWTGSKVKLPATEEIPNIDMEVINYHRPILGTFHAKLCVIDREIGLLQSNNVQDNDNLEMMSHLEGPIVNALYDTLLISWHKHLNPQLPFIQNSAKQVSSMVEDSPGSLRKSVSDDFLILRPEQDILPECTSKDPHYDPDVYAETRRVNSQLNPGSGETRQESTARHLGMSVLRGFYCSEWDSFSLTLHRQKNAFG